MPTRSQDADMGPPFAHVVCAADRSAQGERARRQAAVLAGVPEAVKWINAPRGHAGLLDRCHGADLIVLGAVDAAASVLEHASVPVLLARQCPLGTEVTDRLVVAVDGSVEPECAAEIAGQLAARHGGQVSIVLAPQPNSAVRRALAGTSRVLIRATGVAPRVVGDQPPPEQVVPSAAAALRASLLVLAVGSTADARRRAVAIARCVGCSVLTIPDAPAPPASAPLEP